MKIYRYLYYNLYCIWLRKKDEPENAHINAVITITFLVFVDIICIPTILQDINKSKIIILPEINNEKIWISIILIGAGILNYILLARRDQHKKIIEEFKMSNKEKRRNGILFTLIYIIISLSMPYYIFLS